MEMKNMKIISLMNILLDYSPYEERRPWHDDPEPFSSYEEKPILKYRFKVDDLVFVEGRAFDTYNSNGNFRGRVSDRTENCIYKVIKKTYKKKGTYFINIINWEEDKNIIIVDAYDFEKISKQKRKMYVNKTIEKSKKQIEILNKEHQEKIEYLNSYLKYLKTLEWK